MLGGKQPFNTCSALPDTGTNRTIINEKVIRDANIPCIPSGKETISAAGGAPLGCVGNVLLGVKVEGGDEMWIDALVVSGLRAKCLLSWKDMQRAGIISEEFPAKVFNAETAATEVPNKARCSSTHGDTLDSLMEEFSDVFDDEKVTVMAGEPMRVHIDREDPKYKAIHVNAARRVPLHFQEEADKTLQWFLDSGVIEKVPNTECTEWCSPGFFVPKPGGKVRLVVDYRSINQFVKRQTHVFPSPRDVVRGILPESTWYLRLDAIQGYYQVPLEDEASKLTTFLMPSGRYRFKRAPMGLSCSSDVFCSRTDDILASVPNLLKIVDDALLQAPTKEILLKHLRIALQACREGHLTLSRSKVMMGQSIPFAGYIISKDGVSPDPRRTRAVSQFPVPTDISSLRGFMGLAQQLGFFLPDLAHLTEVLRQLMKKNIAWQWLPVHQQAFEKIREVLTSDLLVKPFDPSLETVLLTDASRLKGLGYAIIQKEKCSGIRLIQCSSRSLNPAETRYATIELECLAIQWAVLDSRFYLQGCDFKVMTDHRPLVGIFAKPLADLENDRLLRFRLKLSDYIMRVEWTPGKTHLIADALSRAPVFDTPEVEDEDVVVICNAVVANDPLLQDMYDAAEEDSSYRSLVKAVISDKDASELPPWHAAKQYLAKWGDLSVVQGVLLCLDSVRIVVPRSMRKQVLQQLHESHSGIQRTRELARQLFYWPGMSRDVKSMIDSCEECQVLRASQPAEPRQSRPEATQPMQSVSADLWSWAGNNYLAATDSFTGMLWCHQMTKTHTKIVTDQLDIWFAQYGYPQVVVSDNGSQFGAEFAEWCVLHSITHAPSSPYFPQSNGMAESAVKRTKQLCKKSENYSDFKRRLTAYLSMPSANSKLSPIQKFFGRRFRTAMPQFENVLFMQPIAGYRVLRIGERVRLQNVKTDAWDEFGTVLEIRKSGRSYVVARDIGRISVRNRRYLKPIPAEKVQQTSDTECDTMQPLHKKPAADTLCDTLQPLHKKPAADHEPTPAPRRGERVRAKKKVFDL